MNESVQKSLQLYVYELLQNRIVFSKEDEQHFYKEVQGYRGERRFEQLVVEKLQVDYIALYSLLFDKSGRLSQIDCLLIFATKLVLVEVKNFENEYAFFDDQFTSLRTNKVIANPLHQLNRPEILLKEILLALNIHLPVLPYVAFVNDRFTLYMKPNDKIVLPTQLHGFFSHLNNERATLNATHFALAEKLRTLHITENRFARIPSYEWATLRKGITCVHCRSWMTREYRHMRCTQCKYRESLASAVVRSTVEYAILFPDAPITTERIHEWVGEMVSIRTILSTLQMYFQKENSRKNASYQFIT